MIGFLSVSSIAVLARFLVVQLVLGVIAIPLAALVWVVCGESNVTPVGPDITAALPIARARLRGRS